MISDYTKQLKEYKMINEFTEEEKNKSCGNCQCRTCGNENCPSPCECHISCGFEVTKCNDYVEKIIS